MAFEHSIWNRLKKTGWGRFFAGLLIGGGFGLAASILNSRSTVTIAGTSLASAAFGGLACVLLEWRDRRRDSNPVWQDRVNKREEQIQQANPNLPPVIAKRIAVSREQDRFTPLVWVGVIVGAFCMLCGVIAFIMKIVALLR